MCYGEIQMCNVEVRMAGIMSHAPLCVAFLNAVREFDNKSIKSYLKTLTYFLFCKERVVTVMKKIIIKMYK